jgi:hypothetical protein
LIDSFNIGDDYDKIDEIPNLLKSIYIKGKLRIGDKNQR